jgi:predicted small secreted protein
MKNIMMAVCLLAATVALSACGTASGEGANSAAPVMEKAVTK